ELVEKPHGAARLLMEPAQEISRKAQPWRPLADPLGKHVEPQVPQANSRGIGFGEDLVEEVQIGPHLSLDLPLILEVPQGPDNQDPGGFGVLTRAYCPAAAPQPDVSRQGLEEVKAFAPGQVQVVEAKNEGLFPGDLE